MTDLQKTYRIKRENSRKKENFENTKGKGNNRQGKRENSRNKENFENTKGKGNNRQGKCQNIIVCLSVMKDCLLFTSLTII